FKTLAAYAQITTALSFNLELSFVDLAYFTGVMKYLKITINVFAVNFSWIMPMSCVITGTNFLTTTYGMCSTYLAIMAGLFAASKYFGRNPGLAAKAQEAGSKAQELAEDAKNTMSVMQGGEDKYRVEGGGDEKKKTDLSAALFNNLLLFTFLILPGISTQIVNTFACTPLVDDDDIMNSDAEGWFLKSDYSVRCHYRGYFDVTNAHRHEDDIQQQVNDAHATAKWFAGLMVLIFPLGVPIMYYFLLWKERDQLDPGEAEMVGFKVVRLKVRRKKQDEKGGGGGEEGGAKKKSKWVYKYLMPERYVEKRFGIDVNAEVAGGRRKSLVGALRLAATEEERKWEAGGGWEKDFNEFYKGHETAEEFDVWGKETSETFRWRIKRFMGWKKRYPLRPFSPKELNAFTLSDEEKGEGGKRKTLTAQWQLFFTLLGALCMRVDIVESYLQYQFDLVMTGLQFVLLVLIGFQSTLKKQKSIDDAGDEDEDEDGIADKAKQKLKNFAMQSGLGGVGSAFGSKVFPVLEDAKGAMGGGLGDAATAAKDGLEDLGIDAEVLEEVQAKLEAATQEIAARAREAVEEVGGRVAEVAREKLEMIEGAYWGGFEEEWDADGDFVAAHATGMCAAVEALSAIGAEAKAAAERARGMDWKGKVGKALDEERRKLQEELKAMLVQSIKDECLGLEDELVEEAVEWLKGEAERAGVPFLFEDKIKAKVGGVLGDKIEIGVDFLCANFFNPKRIDD
ncbi:hypothetical protein TeGR_g12102, partial [Tetraparma gracilis]